MEGFVAGDLQGWETSTEALNAASLTAMVFDCKLVVRNTFLDFGDGSRDSRRGSCRRSRSAGQEPSGGSPPIGKALHAAHCNTSGSSTAAGSDDADEDFDVISTDVDGTEAASESSKGSGLLSMSGSPSSFEKIGVSPTKACSRPSGHDGRPSRHVNKQSGVRRRSNVFVTNMPGNSSEEELRTLFERFGHIALVSIARDGRGYSKGHGNIIFDETDAAHAAIAQCERGRLILLDGSGRKCQLGACWTDLLSQAQHSRGQNQHVGDKGTRCRREKDLQGDAGHSCALQPEGVASAELQWCGVLWPKFVYEPFVVSALEDYEKHQSVA